MTPSILLAMLPELRSGKISTLARPATLLSAACARRFPAPARRPPAIRRRNPPRRRVAPPCAAPAPSPPAFCRWTDARRCLWWKRRAAPRAAHAEHVPREPRRGNRDVRELIHGRLGNDAAVGHEQHALFADARVLDLHHHAARNGADVRRGLDDLEQRPQHAAGDVRRPGNQAVRLVHGQHHRAVEIRLQHGFARLGLAQALFRGARDRGVGEIFQVFARGGIDDAHAFQRNFQILRRRLVTSGWSPSTMGAPSRSA